MKKETKFDSKVLEYLALENEINTLEKKASELKKEIMKEMEKRNKTVYESSYVKINITEYEQDRFSDKILLLHTGDEELYEECKVRKTYTRVTIS